MPKSIVSRSLVLTALLLLAPGAARAQTPELTPELTAQWWQQVLAIPAATNPLTEEGKTDCSLLGTGDVVFLGGTFGDLVTSFGNQKPARRSCSIPTGTAILVPVINAECSTVEGHGDTVEALSACAEDLMNHVTELSVTIDGVPLPGSALRRVRSPGFTFELPLGNLFGIEVTAGETLSSLSVAEGFYVLVPPLPAGKHVIEFGGLAPFPEFDFTFETFLRYTIRVGR